MGGDLQPGCMADRLLTSLGQPQIICGNLLTCNEQVAEALKSGRLPDPEQYPCVSLFFCDIVGYTDICSMLDFQDILDMLHR